MAEKSSNLLRLAVGAGILAVGVVGVAVLVPRRRWQTLGAPLAPMAAALTAWAVGLWDDMTAPTPPVFDDLRPFDEF